MTTHVQLGSAVSPSVVDLVDIETDEVLAVFSGEHSRYLEESIALEQNLRAKQGVDDQGRGLALRDSALRPLDRDELAKAVARSSR